MATRKKTAAKGRKTTKTTAKKTTKRSTTKTTAKKAAAKPKAKSKVAAKSKAKTTARKATRKTATKAKTKTTRKATTAKRATKTSSTPKLPTTAITQKQTKAQIINEIAEVAGLSKAEVKQVFSALRNVVERHVKPKGSGEMTIPELGLKVRRIVKKATKSRMGVNPFTGEKIKIAAKPARKSVKATALKSLKELA